MSISRTLPSAVRTPRSVRRSIGVSFTSTSSHVVAVERLEVLRFQRHPFRAEAVGGGNELLGHLRVLDARAHLVAHEGGDLLVDLRIEEQLGEQTDPEAQRAFFPHLFQVRSSLLGRQIGPPAVHEVGVEAGERSHHAVAQLVESLPVGRPIHVGQLGVLHRDRVLRVALEYRELVHLAGNGLDDLDAGRGGPDDTDALARAIDVPGPTRGVEDPALELVLPGELRPSAALTASRRS